MKEYTMYVLGVRLLAMYIIVKGIISLPQLGLVGYGAGQPDRAQMFLIIIFSIITPIICGIILWCVAKPIAKKMLPSENNIDVDYKGNLMFGQILIAIAGLFIFLMALPDLLFQSVQYIYSDNQAQYMMTWIPYMAVNFLKLLIGICLMFGQKRLSLLLLKLRSRDDVSL